MSARPGVESWIAVGHEGPPSLAKVRPVRNEVGLGRIDGARHRGTPQLRRVPSSIRGV